MQPFGHKGRLEARAHAKGMGRYVPTEPPGQACGHFLARTARRGNRALDASSALAMPGVIAPERADWGSGLRPLPAQRR